MEVGKKVWSNKIRWNNFRLNINALLVFPENLGADLYKFSLQEKEATLYRIHSTQFCFKTNSRSISVFFFFFSLAFWSRYSGTAVADFHSSWTKHHLCPRVRPRGTTVLLLTKELKTFFIHVYYSDRDLRCDSVWWRWFSSSGWFTKRLMSKSKLFKVLWFCLNTGFGQLPHTHATSPLTSHCCSSSKWHGRCGQIWPILLWNACNEQEILDEKQKICTFACLTLMPKPFSSFFFILRLSSAAVMHFPLILLWNAEEKNTAYNCSAVYTNLNLKAQHFWRKSS